MIAILLGGIFVVFGLWGIIQWFGDFLVVLKGFGSVSLLLGGLIAVISGFASLRSSRSNEKSKD